MQVVVELAADQLTKINKLIYHINFIIKSKFNWKHFHFIYMLKITDIFKRD